MFLTITTAKKKTIHRIFLIRNTYTNLQGIIHKRFVLEGNIPSALEPVGKVGSQFVLKTNIDVKMPMLDKAMFAMGAGFLVFVLAPLSEVGEALQLKPLQLQLHFDNDLPNE